MSPLRASRNPLLTAGASLFMAAVGLYSALWMLAVRREPSVSIGVAALTHLDSSIRVDSIEANGPAARAGIRVGDRISAIDGDQLVTLTPLARVVFEGRPGQRIPVTVRRAGLPGALDVELLADPAMPRVRSLTQRLVAQALGLYPLFFFMVSAAVLLLRVDSRDAWLLALLFASFIAGAPYLEPQTPPALRGFALGFRTFFGTLSASLFLYFFSVFPGPSPLERRLPRLKHAWLAVGALLAIAATLRTSSGPPAAPSAWSSSHLPVMLFQLMGFGLGFVSLVWTALSSPPATRRKARMILWGTAAGFGPSFLLFSATEFLGKEPYALPFWVWASCVIALALMPLSFAYAVFKHHVMEIPVLLRRGARYMLVQRGFAILLVLAGIGATFLFASALDQVLHRDLQSMAIGLGTGFGTLLFVAGTRVQRRVRERIDRAFFRSAYDARQILQELADRARVATSRQDLAALLEAQIQSALLPSFIAVYAETRDGVLALASGRMPDEWRSLPPSLPLLSELRRRQQPCDVDESVAFAPLAAAGAESVVPILARDGHLSGVLILGPRLSEEPYSGEDKRLVASAASQAGITLDSIHLAEQMAERHEADRIADHEMELAKQVQSRLLVQAAPKLRSATFAGRCVQARAVGGDYYDFIDLGSGRVGLALADVSGKGFPAALLMASLQASLRSRLAGDRLDLPVQLGAVNQLLHRSSEVNRFATLFFGVYDDDRRTLRYANCGHNPPVVLRADGSIDRLPPTAAALGLFDDWPCETAEVGLGSGDLLAVFSDGVPEAFSDDGEEFGEARLIAALEACRRLSVEAVVDEVLARVTRFSGSEQEDDQTLVIARVA
jgi:sigma-B regulation protein RsbU (phosphoserine phosphatase)